MIVNCKLGHNRGFGSENPVCKGCGECCWFREDGGPLTKCRHLDDEKKCLQYKTRPKMCRNWWCEESYK